MTYGDADRLNILELATLLSLRVVSPKTFFRPRILEMPRLLCRMPLPFPVEFGRIGAILNAGFTPFSRNMRADSLDFFNIGVKSMDSSSSNKRHSSAPTFGSIS